MFLFYRSLRLPVITLNSHKTYPPFKKKFKKNNRKIRIQFPRFNCFLGRRPVYLRSFSPGSVIVTTATDWPSSSSSSSNPFYSLHRHHRWLPNPPQHILRSSREKEGAQQVVRRNPQTLPRHTHTLQPTSVDGQPPPTHTQALKHTRTEAQTL